MMMTTMGSDFWPQTVEGRVLAWLMAVFAFAIFGYITAFLRASFLLRRRPRTILRTKRETRLRSQAVISDLNQLLFTLA